jgi:hypothetical protein
MNIITAVVAIVSGLIVLLGYFFPFQLAGVRGLLINWAVIIAGVAVLIGIANMFFVQMEKIRTRKESSLYSALLVISLLGTALYGSIAGLDNPVMNFTVNAVIIPVEASLLAILAVTLVYASIRLLRRRVELMSIIFLVAALLFMLSVMPTPFGPFPGDQLIAYFLGMFSRGGARGLLIGVALGTLLTGLRVLFGIDRPYGGD